MFLHPRSPTSPASYPSRLPQASKGPFSAFLLFSSSFHFSFILGVFPTSSLLFPLSDSSFILVCPLFFPLLLPSLKPPLSSPSMCHFSVPIHPRSPTSSLLLPFPSPISIQGPCSPSCFSLPLSFDIYPLLSLFLSFCLSLFFPCSALSSLLIPPSF